MTSSSSLGTTIDHDPVRPEPQHRRRGARRGGGDQRGAHLSAGQSARQSHLSQGESGRRADHDHRPDLRQVRHGQAVRRSFDDHVAEAFADSGRGAGDGGRRLAAFGARRCESHPAQQLRPDPGQRAVGAEPAECRPGQRADLRRHRDRRHRRQRPDLERRRLQAADRRLPQRRGGAALRCGRRDRFGAEHPLRRLSERQPRGHADHLPPAGRQHHPDGR